MLLRIVRLLTHAAWIVFSKLILSTLVFTYCLSLTFLNARIW